MVFISRKKKKSDLVLSKEAKNLIDLKNSCSF